MALITFSAGTKAKAAQVNANFALCLLKDAAAEITVSSALALAVGRQGATNPAFQVDSATASSATGVKVTAAAAAGGVAIAAISSGTNENLALDAKGSGTITIGGTSTGAVLSGRGLLSSHATLGIGYSAGAGGTVTQATDKSTNVTLDKVSGQITMHAANLAAGAIVSFLLSNSAIAAGDVLILNHFSGGTRGAYTLTASTVAGAAGIYVRNNTAGGLAEAIVIAFAVVKGVSV